MRVSSRYNWGAKEDAPHNDNGSRIPVPPRRFIAWGVWGGIKLGEGSSQEAMEALCTRKGDYVVEVFDGGRRVEEVFKF